MIFDPVHELLASISPLSSIEWAVLYPRVLLGGSAIVYILMSQKDPERADEAVSKRDIFRAMALAHLLGLLFVVAGFASNWLWSRLSGVTLAATSSILSKVVSNVFVDVAQLRIGTEKFNVILTDACSGLEGMGLISAFLGIYLYIQRNRLNWPLSFVIFPIAWCLSWCLNIVRIVFLILMGDSFSAEIAMEGFHSQSGWLAFILLSLAFTWSVENSSFFIKIQKPKITAHLEDENVAAPYLWPLIILLCSNVGTALFSNNFNYFSPIGYLFSGVALFFSVKKIGSLITRPSKLALSIGCGIGVAWISMSPLHADKNHIFSSGLSVMGDLAKIWLVIKVMGYCFITPVVEELAFRGFFTRWIQDRNFSSVDFNSLNLSSCAISSLIFGALHQNWILGAGAGFLFCWVIRRSGCLSDGIVAHVLANCVIAMYVLATGHWGVLS